MISSILQHLTHLSPILLSLLNTVVNNFAFVKAQGWKKDKPTTLNTLTTVGVRNGNISILQHLCLFRPNFAIPPYNAVSNLSFLLAQVWKRKQPTILNPMTTVGVPSSILQHLSLSLPNVCYPTAPIII